MKKVLFLAVLVLSYQADLRAQDSINDNFVLVNPFFDFKRGNDFSNSNQGAALLYVKSINKDQAWRFGIGNKEFKRSSETITSIFNDTLTESRTSQSTALPHLILGKEWRKYLHKDVMLVGGADVSLGAGPNTQSIVETKNYYNQSENDLIEQKKNGFGVFGEFALFTGVRLNWNKLTLGYSVSAPVNAAYFNGPDSDLFINVDIYLRHNLSIGLRINNKKSTQ